MEGFTRFQRNKNRGRYRFWGDLIAKSKDIDHHSRGDQVMINFPHTAPTWPHVVAFFFSGSDPSKPHAAERD